MAATMCVVVRARMKEWSFAPQLYKYKVHHELPA
jgi:hypothetical protein